MIRYIESDEHAAFIEMVAIQLLRIIPDHLHQMCRKINYFTQVGIITEIFEWSIDFFELYYDDLASWKTFKMSEANIFNACSIEDFVIAFGHMKLDHFSTRRVKGDEYFVEKYRDFYLDSFAESEK